MKSEILETVEEAKREVVEAKQALEAVLVDLRGAKRAEKTTITNALELALGQLARATETLTTLEQRARTEKL